MPRSVERWAENTLEAQGQKPKRKAKAKAAAPAKAKAAAPAKPSAAPRKASRGRPALDAWRKALPDLTDTGQQLQGACPSCGGEDRFSVRYAGDWSEAAPGVFCRKCAPDGSAAPDALDAIFKVAFAKPSPFAKAPDNVVPIEAYEDRRAGAAKRRQKDEPRAYRGVADVPMRAVRWAWKGWLAKGVLHVLAGAPAAGKGTVLAKMAACLVKGEWPDGSKSEPGSVMLHGSEDSLSQIVLPRLAGAGLTREEIDSSVIEILPDAMKRPEVMLKQLQDDGAMANLRGIILDDLAEGLAVTEDGNSARPVQRFLRRLTYLGEQLDIPVIGGRHTKKFSQDFGGDVTQLIMGSNQFYAVPRVALLLIKNERPEGEKEDEEKSEDQMVQDANRATLVRCKANLPVGWDTGGWAISGVHGAIVGKDEAHGGIPIQASVASVWEPLHGGYLTLARYALGVRGDDSRRKADGRGQERERTKGCIREHLKGGGMHPVAAVVQAATEATGQTERAIYGTLKAMEATGEIVRRSVNAAIVEAEALPAGTRKVVQLAKAGEAK